MMTEVMQKLIEHTNEMERRKARSQLAAQIFTGLLTVPVSNESMAKPHFDPRNADELAEALRLAVRLADDLRDLTAEPRVGVESEAKVVAEAGQVAGALGTCAICREPIDLGNVARRADGATRLDSRGRLWCRACTEEHDSIDPETGKPAPVESLVAPPEQPAAPPAPVEPPKPVLPAGWMATSYERVVDGLGLIVHGRADYWGWYATKAGKVVHYGNGSVTTPEAAMESAETALREGRLS